MFFSLIIFGSVPFIGSVDANGRVFCNFACEVVSTDNQVLFHSETAVISSMDPPPVVVIVRAIL